MNRKKMVIHGCTGLKNSGDEAILQTIIQQFGKEYEITAISKNVEYTRRMHSGIRVIPDEEKLCKEAIRDCDLFLLGGGGLLQDETTVFNVAVWLKYLKYAIKLRKKTCLYANSIGPVHSGFNRRLIKKYLADVDLITLRDKSSAKLLEKIGLTDKQKIYVTADPVFSMEWERKAQAGGQQSISSVDRGCGTQIGEKASKEGAYVCMTLRHWFDMVPFIPARICSKYHIRRPGDWEKYKAYVRTMAECTEYINRELGYGVRFLSFYYGRDEKVARDVMARVRPTKGVKNELVTGEYLTPEEAIQEIASARFLVGMRLHSMIYAIKTGTPMVMIDYSSKVRGMAKLNGLGSYIVKIDELESGRLKEKIEQMLREEERLKKRLAQQHRVMAEREKENKRLVDELVFHCIQ